MDVVVHARSWKGRIEAARAQYFVGRAAELALWREALAASEPAFSLLWIVGPGGVGKSTLLGRLSELCGGAAVQPILIDTRALMGSQTSLLDHLALQLGVRADDVVATFHAGSRRALLIDTAEDLGGLEDWLREDFLPALPVGTLVAIAGRRPPSPAWRTDAGWTGLLRVIGLRNLSSLESRQLLELRGVDLSAVPQLLVETHGHPLALALVADVLQQDAGAGALDLRAHPDVVAALLSRFVLDAPDPLHRRALEIAAHVRVTNEGVLRTLLELTDARPVFDWVASKSFAVPHAEGLYLHDLAAHAIDADHRRRDPDGYVKMHKALRAPIIERLHSQTGAEQYRSAMDLSWLHRFSAILGTLVDWDGARSLTPAPLTTEDVPHVIEATRRFEGDAAADLIAHWMRTQPEAFTVVRSSPTRTLGFICSLIYERRSDTQKSTWTSDPRLEALVAHAEQRRPLRNDERIELCLWLAYDTHVDPSALVSQTSIANIRSWFGRPGITWGGFAIPARLDAWRPLMSYLDHHPAGDVVVGATRYALFAHDWRTVTPTAFLDMMAEREISRATDGADLEPPREVLALSHDEFVIHVRHALRDFCSDDALRASPLTRCRVVLDVPEPAPVPLRRALELAAESLTRSGKDEPLHAAVKLTYLDPARTQEEAASLLGLAFSTYRRHLASGVERVAAWLWERDLHGYESLAAPPDLAREG